MCLVKVKQEEDHIVPYRVVNRNRSPPRRRASHRHSRDVEHRYSRTEIVHEASPRPSQSHVSSPRYVSAPSYVPVPTPKPLMIPAPQPAPVFVQPPPMPMPMPMPAPPPPPSHISSHHTQSHHGGAHYVEVSPRSSISSRSSSPPRSEYVYREREIRRERVSEPENPRYEHYRYVEPASSESDVHESYQRRDRQRSRSRGGYEDPRGSYNQSHTRVSVDARRR
jgi:hypothetical protein